MTEAPHWLDDVIVVNENCDPLVAGDVQIYRNEGDVGRQLEHWYVGDVEHLALTRTGQKAALGLRDKLVVVERLESFPAGPALLNRWLEATAQHLLSVRTERAQKGKAQLGTLEARGVLPTTTEGLIAYIGFTK
jgi:hypothetical protein